MPSFDVLARFGVVFGRKLARRKLVRCSLWWMNGDDSKFIFGQFRSRGNMMATALVFPTSFESKKKKIRKNDCD